MFATDIAPFEAKKSKEFILKYLKGMYSSKEKSGQSVYDNDLPRIILNRKYAEGLQSIEKYKNLLGLAEGETSYLNLDYTVVPITSKFVNILVGEMINNVLKIIVTAIDPFSKNKKNDEYHKYTSNLENKDFDKQIKEITGINVIPKGEYVPESQEELDVKLKMGNFKLDLEIAMEQFIDWELYRSDWKQIESKIIKDLIVIKKSCVKVYFDENKKVRIRYADWSNMIVPYCVKNDLSDAKHVGEIIKIPLHQLRRMAKDLSEKELFEIAKAFSGKEGNAGWKWGNYYKDYVSSFGQYFNKNTSIPEYDDYLIPVLDGYFISVNTEKWDKRATKYGGFYFDKSNGKSKENSKSVAKDIEYLYKGKWIVGTDFLFDFGLAEDIFRTRENGTYSPAAHLPYMMIAPDILDMQSKSMVERIIPHADQIQLIFFKTQHVMSKISPPGRAIDVNALKDVFLGKGGSGENGAWTPLDLMEVAEQTGYYFYNGVDDEGRPMNRRPIDSVDLSTRGALSELIGMYNFHLQQIRDVTGLNEIRDASTPDKDALVGIQKLALQSSRNATREIYHNFVQIYEQVAKRVAQMVQYNISNKRNIKYYQQALGENNIKVIDLLKDMPLAEIAVKVEAMPTEEEKAILEANIQQSLVQKEIRIEDGMIARKIPNIKLGAQYLTWRRKVVAKELQEAQQQNIMLQMEQANQAAQVKAQGDQANAQTEAQLKQTLINTQLQADMQLETLKHQNKMKELTLQNEYKSKHIEQASEEDFKTTALTSAVKQPQVFTGV